MLNDRISLHCWLQVACADMSSAIKLLPDCCCRTVRTSHPLAVRLIGLVLFGEAKIVRPGTHVTVITYGAVVPRALQAAHKAHREDGIETEVIDLRTLSPYDWEAIATSVRKTSRVIVAHEDMLSWGYGAEIAARIAEELFDDLDAPVRRVASMDTFVAYQPILEDAILPQPENLYQAIKALIAH